VRSKYNPVNHIAFLMPPPNPFWVQRYLKEHAIDSLLATAVNQAVAARSKDPAASLACFFSKLSKRNGEIVSLKASRVMNQQLEQAIKLTIEVKKKTSRT